MKKQNIDSMLESEQRMSAGMCTCGELRKAARAVTMLYDDAVKCSRKIRVKDLPIGWRHHFREQIKQLTK